jgi:glutaminyl-tRNA synthetase
VEENLRLFRDMKEGKFADGQCVLRAKIDMAHVNMNMRDPTLYRIKKEPHPMTGSTWKIYPMYDFAHAISDALEGITHSLCTLEFEGHRPLYDWCVDSVLPSGILPFKEQGWRPRQYEFSRLNLQYTVLSKRKLISLVSGNHLQGWDDPRMPTLCGLRRRGFPAASLRLFADRVGISKVENNIEFSVLEDSAREVLDEAAPRLFAIMRPLKVTITNWAESISSSSSSSVNCSYKDDCGVGEQQKEVETKDPTEVFTIERHPKHPEMGIRELPMTSSLYIEQDDFFDTRADLVGTLPGLTAQVPPPKGYKRLLLGGQVRLKKAFVIACDAVVRDPATQQVVELRCSYVPGTRGGAVPAGAAKVKGIVQWVSAPTAVPADLYLYDRLFHSPAPGRPSLAAAAANAATATANATTTASHATGSPASTEEEDFLQDLNPNSLEVVRGAVVEPSVLQQVLAHTDAAPTATSGNAVLPSSRAALGMRPGTFQFERIGYFTLDVSDAVLKDNGACNGSTAQMVAHQPLRFNRIVTLKDTWQTRL